MELRRLKLAQELREAREDLLNINFATDITNRIGVSRPYALADEWVIRWDATFRKSNMLGGGMVNIRSSVVRELDGYEREEDIEVFNEMRPIFVGFIDLGLNIIDQGYEVKPVLEEYIKRVKDTKLAEMLKEFNMSKDTSPNLVAIAFRTILALIIQEKAKRLDPQSNTATRVDLALDKMIDSARNDNVLSSDELRLLESFKATHKDIYDFVAHRPGANKMVDKSEVATMVDLLNKLLPAIIN
jgi:hypothetical protein